MNIKNLVQIANLGDGDAQYELANCYEEGNGVEQDYEEAAWWYRQAAENGHKKACNKMGQYCYYGQGVTKNLEKAIFWLQSNALNDDVEAQYYLGMCYYDQEKRNGEEAVKWLKKAAKRKHSEAMYYLGQCYSEGIGVEVDCEEAKWWYRNAAQAGLAIAQCALAEEYVNKKKSAYWHLRAAKNGNVDSQYYIGSYYESGSGVKKNLNKAFKWYEKAAMQDDVWAQAALAHCYLNGFGVKADEKLGVYWYEKAAKQAKQAKQDYGCIGECYERCLEYVVPAIGGDSNAQLELARIFFDEVYIDEPMFANSQRGFEWLERAARQGNFEAMYELGKHLQWIGVYYQETNERGGDESYFKKALGENYHYEDFCKKAIYWFEQLSIEKEKFDYEQLKQYCPDVEESEDDFRIKARLAKNHACYCVAERYRKGIGVKQDWERAVKWYHVDHTEAQRLLGICYCLGCGVEKNKERTIYCWEQAAKNGDEIAQRWLALSYDSGIIGEERIEKDREKAFYWAEKLAIQGDCYGQEVLGRYYDSEETVEQRDKEKAFYWYSKAAVKRRYEAAEWLSHYYLGGKEKDVQKAKYWQEKTCEWTKEMLQMIEKLPDNEKIGMSDPVCYELIIDAEKIKDRRFKERIKRTLIQQGRILRKKLRLPRTTKDPLEASKERVEALLNKKRKERLEKENIDLMMEQDAIELMVDDEEDLAEIEERIIEEVAEGLFYDEQEDLAEIEEGVQMNLEAEAILDDEPMLEVFTINDIIREWDRENQKVAELDSELD